MISLLTKLPFRKILAVMLVLGVLSAILGVLYFGYLYLTELSKRAEKSAIEASALRSETLRMKQAIMITNDAINAAAEDADAWKARYEELRAQPPEEVVIYREAATEPSPEILAAQSCTEALVELSKVLNFPGGGQ